MRHALYTELVEKMKADRRDFTLPEIYRIVCRPPHVKNLTTPELHRRCSRAIGEARAALKKQKLVLAPGKLKHSYVVTARAR